MRHALPFRRRASLQLGFGLVGLSLLPRPASAEMTPALRAALDRILAGRSADERGVTLRLPAVAENGNSVPLTVSVDSPMTVEDHIRRIHVLATGNPTPEVATFRLTPALGRARVETRIRLGQTQEVLVLAESSRDAVLLGRAEVKVTIGGCGG